MFADCKFDVAMPAPKTHTYRVAVNAFLLGSRPRSIGSIVVVSMLHMLDSISMTTATNNRSSISMNKKTAASFVMATGQPAQAATHSLTHSYIYSLCLS